MNFALSEEQNMLQEMAKQFVNRESSLRRIRQLREDELGFSREVHGKMAELGWLGMIFPEAHGGQDMGMVEMSVVMEEMGRGLIPEPVLSSVLLGVAVILFRGTDGQQGEWLPRIAAGEAVVTLGYLEKQSRYDAFDVATTATRDGGGWILTGEKTLVPDAGAADAVVVTARKEGVRRER